MLNAGLSDEYKRINQLIQKDAKLAWRALLEFLEGDPPPDEALSLTESFLFFHVAEFIDAVESEALRNPRLAEQIPGITDFGGAGPAMDRLVALWARLRE